MEVTIIEMECAWSWRWGRREKIGKEPRKSQATRSAREMSRGMLEEDERYELCPPDSSSWVERPEARWIHVQVGRVGEDEPPPVYKGGLALIHRPGSGASLAPCPATRPFVWLKALGPGPVTQTCSSLQMPRSWRCDTLGSRRSDHFN